MRYLIKSGDQNRGPFTSKQLRELASSGQLSPEDQIREESDSNWRPASKFKGLFDNGDSKGDADVIEATPRRSPRSKTRRSSQRPTKNSLVIGAILLIGIAVVGAAIQYLASKPSGVAQKPADPVEQQPIATTTPANVPTSSKSETSEAEIPKSTLASVIPAKSAQQEWADKLKLPVEWKNSLGTEFVLVPPGEFQMGSDEPESHVAEKPIHTVRITKPFYLGKYPVMVSEFSQFVAATKLVTAGETRKDGYAGWGLGDGSMAKANDIHWRNPGFQQTDRDPVVMVTPVEAKAYCDYVSKATGMSLRLPKEAEWEYAARGPENLRYPWGNTWNGALSNHADRTLRTAGYAGRHTDGCPDLRYAGYEQNKSDAETDDYAFTSPVGALKNASWCGAFDMSGNVWQWLTDFKDDKYYASSPKDDPTGAANGLTIRRGGSFLNDSINCRSTQRFQGGGEERDVTTGFRLVLEVDQVLTPSKKGPEEKSVPASPTVTPNDDKLAFRDDGSGNFVFNTGVVQGSVQKEGTSDTLRPVSYVDPDFRINGDNHGLLIPYRFLTPQKRYGFGSWEWHHTGRLLIDGGIQLNWEPASDRPFAFSTEYRWKAADTVDMTLVFTPDTDLQNFELFVGSYFNKFSKGAVYTQDSGSGKPGFTETPADKGVMQLFPRNETVLGLVRDGRWTFPPFPNNWAIRTALQAPLALGKDNNTGVTVLLMSPPEDCFAVSSAFTDQGLFALYLSLFGKDVKRNESLIGRARLVFGKNISDEKALEAYQKYLSESKPTPETKGPSVTESQSQQTSNERDVAPNTLTKAEEAVGWKLLFDGKSTNGWRNYKKESVGPGWKVENGTLVRAKEGAEDIITVDEYDAFEFTIDYNISKGGNSGVLYHVTESGRWPYVTGPEIQIQDNKDGQDSQKSGWLYELYSSPNDATRPAEQWNTIRILITPEKCQTFMNGQKYYEYVKSSDDWNKRVAKSKFPGISAEFGKPTKGHICLQDHGNVVSFRNIKIRLISQGEKQKSKEEPQKQSSSVKKAAPRKLPPAAIAHGYTKCVIDEKPVAEDVATVRTGDHKWFSGQVWMDHVTLDHYKNARGMLAISAGGCIVNNSRDMKPAKLPYLPGADGFYVEFDTQLSDNHPDHNPALFLMPIEHIPAATGDHYPGDPEGFQRWMELDVDEGGWGPGVCGAVFSSSGIAPDIKHVGNDNRNSNVPVERTKMNTFGAAYDPKRPAVSWWLNGKFLMEAGPPAVPEIAKKQNFYLIIAAQVRPKRVPYRMYIGGVRAYVPPTSKLPEVDVAVVKPKRNGGTLVLTVSEPDADLQVLTEEGTVEDTRVVEKKSESIAIDAGKHRLKVWKEGFHVFTEDFKIDAKGKKSITAKLAPVVKKLDGRVTPNEHWNSPAFQNWVDYVRSMPAEKQIEAVEKKLMELNPGFYGKLTSPREPLYIPVIDHHGQVTELAIVADYVSDISPVRVFGQLAVLKCVGSGLGKGYLSDLTPLKGMRVTQLEVWNTQVKDLSPLEGMPLELLGIGATPVSDLSPLKLASQSRWGPVPLKVKLFCDKTPISDLSPLQGLQLQSILFTPKNITAGIDVIRQMKSIESIGAEGQGMTTPDEFWKKYDAGEFSKSK